MPWCQTSGQLPSPPFSPPPTKGYVDFLTAGYADFHKIQMVKEWTRRNNYCGLNLHHIQPSEQPALFHAL